MTTNLSHIEFPNHPLSKGMSGDEVHNIQTYLQHYGYLQNIFGEIHHGDFDDATEKAIRLYQNCFSLPVTGIMDQATLCEMAKPRCGFPDIPQMSETFTTISRWEKTKLTYKFAQFSKKLGQAVIERDVANAFMLWSDQCGLSFTCKPNNKDVDILIDFVTGEHGDGNAFDGPSGVLAHAFFPPPNGGPLSGDTHFDDAENWTSNLMNSKGIDFLTVAAHEFGHSIGLGHSRDRLALMFPSYSGAHRFLSQDDIAGCQSLYGASV